MAYLIDSDVMVDFTRGNAKVGALIAATAIANGFTLASKNRNHFWMISELKLEVPGY